MIPFNSKLLFKTKNPKIALTFKNPFQEKLIDTNEFTSS